MLKLARRRLLRFLLLCMATLLWVREYRKMVCQSGVYMLLIRKERKKMSDQNDWIYSIIPKEQADDMHERMEQIEQRSQNGVTIVMSANDESAVEICRTWQEALHGDAMAWIKISSFVSGIIGTIEEHLNEEGINPYED